MNIWVKYAVTAFLVVAVSEIAKRSDRLGALVSSLPLMTLLVLMWLYLENQTDEKISNHAFYTFWYVIGSLPFFLIFPYMLPKTGFYGALVTAGSVTIVFFYFYALLLERFSINLL